MSRSPRGTGYRFLKGGAVCCFSVFFFEVVLLLFLWFRLALWNAGTLTVVDSVWLTQRFFKSLS